MAKKQKDAITPTRSENYAEWYQQVIKAADLAENSPVRGCMVIKPWGYAIWEKIQRVLDAQFKATGHQNAYFPLFVPLSFLKKEAQHVQGFAKECAVVTHHRLEADEEGGLKPTGELAEPLIVRPTSETIIGDAFAKWIQSYRDLPLLINQWANVVRWEMRPRMFLRTAEFLWQEGHTAHASEDEALYETRQMLDIYAAFAEQWMAMPVFRGEKTESERFPGAVRTFCIEAMMQDGRALQAGTSHFLGQNFSRASGMEFLDQEGKLRNPWTTSWGVSTRLIGGLIMAHSDDDGLVLPPRLAPAHVAILPVLHKEEARARIMEHCDVIARELRDQKFDGHGVEVVVDTRDLPGGEKVWQWIKKGIPVRVEVGPREADGDSVFVGRRDSPPRDKASFGREEFVSGIGEMLDSIQESLLRRTREFRDQHVQTIDSRDEFYEFFKDPEPGGGSRGFALAHFGGRADVEEQVKNDLGVTVRCIPLEGGEPGQCPFSDLASPQRVVWAKAY